MPDVMDSRCRTVMRENFSAFSCGTYSGNTSAIVVSSDMIPSWIASPTATAVTLLLIE